MRDDHPLEQLETTQRSLNRAQTESFDFRLHQGDILVTNLTYEDPSEHVYRVTIQDGVPIDCTCPADAHYEPACKHRIGVAMRTPVVSAANRMQVAADGGVVESPELEMDGADSDAEADGADSEAAADDCSCDKLPDGVPCWPCFRDYKAEFED